MITTIILAYNEEEVLDEALKSIEGFGDEILVIDSKSKDNTVKIAKKYKAKVIEHQLDSFAEQRNLGLKTAKNDWIFYLDADERITPEFQKEAHFQISTYNPDGSVAGFFVKRKTFYLGKDWGFTDQVQRLFYKKKLKEWYGTVHETPRVEGKLETLSSPIVHITHRTLSQMVEKTNKWSGFEAELRYHAHHPKMTWWRMPRVMIPEFFRSYMFGGGYKNGTRGFIESMYQAFSIFITYAKLWELQNKKK